VRSLRWAKILLQNTSAKALNSTPSHLSSSSINISFGAFLRAPSLNLILGNLFYLRGLSYGTSYHDYIITITRSLWLKWSFCQQVNNAKHQFSITRITYSRGVGCLESLKSLGQAMRFPPLAINPPCQLTHILGNIF
jgi:hypothetical protein